MRISEARKNIKAYMEIGKPVFMWGEPGVGKSDTVRQIARSIKPTNKAVAKFCEQGIPVIDFRAILRDTVDLRGIPSLDLAQGIARWLPPSDLPNVERHGPEGIFFMDELNQAPQSVQAACYSLVLDRRIGEYVFPDGWYIIGAGNMLSSKSAAQRMPTGLANRFAHVEVEANLDDWCDWAVKHDVSSQVIAFLRYKPAALHMMPKGDEPSFPTPRAWESVSRVIATDAASDQARRQSLVQGLIGEGAAVEFEGFLRVYLDLPSLDDILTNPKKAQLPKNVAAKWAVATGLARRVTPKNFGAALTYMERMEAEFMTITVWDACKRDRAFRQTTAFTDWANRNEALVIGD